MVRRAVGSNQYRTRSRLDALPGPDLMNQVSVSPSRRCGEVWGTRCRAMVGPPDYSHAAHGGIHHPDILSQVADPHWVLDQMGGLMRAQHVAALAQNPALSYDDLLVLLSGPHGADAGAAREDKWPVWERDHPLGLSPSQMDDQQWFRLLHHWPRGKLRDGRASVWYAACIHMSDDGWAQVLRDPTMLHQVDRAMGLVSAYQNFPDSRWADLANRLLDGSWQPKHPHWVWKVAPVYSDDPAITELCIRAVNTDDRDTIVAILEHRHPTDERWIPVVQGLMARNMHEPYVVSLAVQHLMERAPGRVDPAQMWRDLPQLHAEHPDHRRWSGVLGHLAKHPQCPTEAVITCLFDQWSSGYTQGWPHEVPLTDTVVVSLATGSRWSGVPDPTRKRLMEHPACPPQTLKTEALGRNMDMAIAAALNRNCPPEGVGRVLQIRSISPAVIDQLMRHPNLPEEYRLLRSII